METNADGTVKLRCHYEVLGVEKDADISTIKKAHRKLALRLHPDKNIGGDDSIHRLFLEVQQAYECLNDPAERKWYDDHRDAILKGWSASGGGSQENVDILFDVIPFMFAGCYRGYLDDATGFYSIYRNVFNQVYQGERDGCEASKTAVDYLDVTFGASDSSWDTVVAFYQAWESFSSVLNYAWADQWNVQEAEQRRVRRAMDEDNKRARRKARHTRNDEIAALVHFVKRRDPRVIYHKERQEAEKLAKEKEIKEAAVVRKKEKEKAMEEWREQAELEAEAVAEVDKLQGRIRLADLEDDYDYGGGKKRGKGRKKKGSQMDEDDNVERNGEVSSQLETNATEADENKQNCLPGETITREDARIAAPQPQEEQRAVVNDLICDCCQEEFQNKKDMLNHLKSKRHKDAASARKLDKKQDDETDKKRDQKKKKKGKYAPSDCSDGFAVAEVSDLHPCEGGPSNSPEVDLQVNTTPIEEPQLHLPAENDLEVISDDDDDGDADDIKPDFWRCQCCQKDFQSEGQMENHMKSKKHRAVFKAYEKVLGKKLLEEVIEELEVGGDKDYR